MAAKKLSPEDQAALDELNTADARELERLNTVERARSVPQGTAAPAPRMSAAERIEQQEPDPTPSPPIRDTITTPAEARAVHVFGRGADEIGGTLATIGVGNPMVPNPERLREASKEMRDKGGFLPAYVENRDAARDLQNKTRSDHPGTAARWELLGGAATAAPTLGAGIAPAIVAGSIVGTNAALGAQDSGPGKLATPGELAVPVAIGSTVGGLVGGAVPAAAEGAKRIGQRVAGLIDKVRAGAPARVDKRLLQEAVGNRSGERAAKSVRDPIADHQELALKVIREEKINTADPAAMATGARAAGQKADAAAQRALDDAGEVNADIVLKRLRTAQSRMKKPSDVRAVQKQIDALEDSLMPEMPLSDQDLLRRLSESAKGKVREKIGARDTDVLEVAKRYDLDKSVRDPKGHLAATQKAVDGVGGQIEKLYSEVEKAHGETNPLTLDFILEGMGGLQKSYAKNPATEAEAATVQKLIDSMVEKWGKGQAPGVKVPVRVQDFRAAITATQGKGYAGSFIDPSGNQQVQREMAIAGKRVLDEYMDFVGEKKAIDALNRDYSTLVNLRKAAEQRAAAAPLKPPAVAKGAGTGKVPLREVNDLAEQMKPRPPSIISQREALKVRGKRMASEEMAEALHQLVDQHAPAVREHLERREVADLLTQAGASRFYGKTFAPDMLERLQKNPNLNLTGAPSQGAVFGVRKVAEALDRRLTRPPAPAKPPSAVGRAVRELARDTEVESRARQAVNRRAAAEEAR